MSEVVQKQNKTMNEIIAENQRRYFEAQAANYRHMLDLAERLGQLHESILSLDFGLEGAALITKSGGNPRKFMEAVRIESNKFIPGSDSNNQ